MNRIPSGRAATEMAAGGPASSRSHGLWFAIVLLIVGLPGCQTTEPAHPGPPNYTNFRAGEFVPGAVLRVAILPLENETPHVEAAERMQRAIANEIADRQAYEVVVVPAGECPLDPLGLAVRGYYPAQLLADVGNTYHVDAVVLGRLRDYQPYGAPRIGCVAHLIAVTDGRVLASVDGTWDARTAAVAAKAQAFAGELLLPAQMNMPDLILQSPDYYSKFVAREIAQALSADDPSPSPTVPDASAPPLGAAKRLSGNAKSPRAPLLAGPRTQRSAAAPRYLSGRSRLLSTKTR